MKIYISADIEGITGVTHWDETLKHKGDYRDYQKQMTLEVAAACEGFLEAGASEIYVQDAHHTGRNILADLLPEPVKLIRGWSGDPMAMLQQLEPSFSGIAMIGYHSSAGCSGNPLSHSMAEDLNFITLNGNIGSEFLLHYYGGLYYKVPTLLVSGDQMLIDQVSEINDTIEGVAVKEGIGGSTCSLHPKVALEEIFAAAQRAGESDIEPVLEPMPHHFTLEIGYKQHHKAYRASFYPGVKLLSPNVIRFESKNYFDIMRLLLFVV